MCAFDMVVLGSGGGPDETNLSGYLIKAHEDTWEDGIIALEAGSGMGALARILKKSPELFGYPSLDCNKSDGDGERLGYSAYNIYSLIQCFLITHAHLDHISSLILSAGSVDGPRKRIYGSLQTLNDIEVAFNGRLWPELASWDEAEQSSRLLYQGLEFDTKYKSITRNVSVLMMPVSHGLSGHAGSMYDSTAYFIRHDIRQREFLFFGDVEPDALSCEPRNKRIWEMAAGKVGISLSSIFIECSWPSSRPNEMLYGHLNPQYLLTELTVLATEVVKLRREASGGYDSLGESDCPRVRKRRRISATAPRSPEVLHNALRGVCVYITHCKARFGDSDCESIQREIAGQVRALIERDNLGAQVVAVEQGMSIKI